MRKKTKSEKAKIEAMAAEVIAELKAEGSWPVEADSFASLRNDKQDEAEARSAYDRADAWARSAAGTAYGSAAGSNA